MGISSSDAEDEVGQDQDRTGSERIAELLDGVMSGRLSRRTFLAGSAALGAAATVAGGIASAGRVAARTHTTR